MTYYDILGISPDATLEEIRGAYRNLAKRYHPDLLRQAEAQARQQAEELLKTINEAYRILSDAERRAEYDSKLRFHHWGGQAGASRWARTSSRKPATPAEEMERFEEALYNEWAHQEATRYAEAKEAQWARRAANKEAARQHRPEKRRSKSSTAK